MLIFFTVYVPTNRGLAFVREEGLQYVRERTQRPLNILECRGEELKSRVDQAIREGVPCVGALGEDLLFNSLAGQYGQTSAVGGDYRSLAPLGRRPLGFSSLPYPVFDILDVQGRGSYESLAFGLPALCFLVRGGMESSSYRGVYEPSRSVVNGKKDGISGRERFVKLPSLRGKRIAAPVRYRQLVERLMEESIPRSNKVDFVFLEGQVEVTASTDRSLDYAVDIVATGRTCRESGMGVAEVLYLSEGVVFGDDRPRRKGPDSRSGRQVEADVAWFLLSGRDLSRLVGGGWKSENPGGIH